VSCAVAERGGFDFPRFGRRFLPLALLFCCAAGLLPEGLLQPASRFTALGAAALLELFGIKAAVAGTMLTCGGFRAEVIPECTPLFMIALLLSFVLASSVPPASKALGILYGVPLLTLLNLIRIALVVLAGANYPALFEYVHIYLGQVAMIFAVCAVCLAWFRSATKVSSPESALPFALRFLAVSSLLFLAWLKLNGWYLRLGDALLRPVLALFDYRLEVTYRHELYYQTFNLIGFAALLLAARSLTARERMQGIGIGFVFLFASHLGIRICDLLLTTLHLESALLCSTILNSIGDYLVPVGVWLAVKYSPPHG